MRKSSVQSASVRLLAGSSALCLLMVVSCGKEGAAESTHADEGGYGPDSSLPSDGGLPLEDPDGSDDSAAVGPDAAPRVPLSHRPSATACPARPPGTPVASTRCGGNGFLPGRDGGPVPDGGFPNGCASDSDCTSGINGRCYCTYTPQDSGVVSACIYDECATDNDCSSGQACDCGPSDPGATAQFWRYVCTTANCHTDSDCGDGGYCSPSRLAPCGYVGPFACHTADDECVNDADCGPVGGSIGCIFSPSLAHWVCATVQCIDGGTR
jgi:hypothetical protein